MKVLKNLFKAEDSNKQIQEILARGKSLLEKNFYDWAAVEFNKAMELNPKLAAETVTKLFQEMQGGGNPDGIISLGINILQMDPKNVEMANLLGNAYRKKHDWKRAKNMYQHCLKHDAENKFAIYNMAATMARVEVQDGMAVSAIEEFEKMTDFVLPDIKEGMENLIEMQQHFVDDKDEVDQEQSVEKTEESMKTEDTDDSEVTEEKEEIKDTKEIEEKEEIKDTEETTENGSKEKEKTEVNTDKTEQEDETQAETSSIDPLKTFNYISSNLEKESTEEEEALFTLGIYCLQNKEANIAQRVFKRLLLREKDNANLQCFLVLAISLGDEIDKAIKTFQGILGQNPNHRYSNVNMGILFMRKRLIQKSRVRFFTTFKLLERSQGDYDINACLEKADNHYQDNREKKALEVYEPLIPEITSEDLLSRIAKLYLDNKSWDDAFEIIRRILRKNRQNKEAREGMKLIYSAYLMDTDNYLKNNDATNAAVAIEKALKIAPNKKLIHKAVSIYRLLDNENKVYELEQTLKNMEKKEIQSNIAEKISLAEEEESKGNLKGAIRYYEEAIKIDPQNSTLKKLIGLCSRINRPDLAEKFTNWFNNYQHSVQEKEKAQAREAFKKSEKTDEESNQDED